MSLPHLLKAHFIFCRVLSEYPIMLALSGSECPVILCLQLPEGRNKLLLNCQPARMM